MPYRPTHSTAQLAAQLSAIKAAQWPTDRTTLSTALGSAIETANFTTNGAAIGTTDRASLNAHRFPLCTTHLAAFDAANLFPYNPTFFTAVITAHQTPLGQAHESAFESAQRPSKSTTHSTT